MGNVLTLPKKYICDRCKACKNGKSCTKKENIIDHAIHCSKNMEKDAWDGWSSQLQQYDTKYMTSVLKESSLTSNFNYYYIALAIECNVHDPPFF